MRGEIGLINKFLVESGKLPFQGKTDEELLRIVSVINSEYWKEFRRKLEYYPHGKIVVKGLGSWQIFYSRLKKYIWDLVKKIRSCKKRLEILKLNKDFDINNSMTYSLIKDLKIKLNMAWMQLNEQRELYILRYLRYTAKKRKTDPNFKPKYDYTWFPYSFKQKLRNNSGVDMSLIS